MFLDNDILNSEIINDTKIHQDIVNDISKLFSENINFYNDYNFFCKLNSICKQFSPYFIHSNINFEQQFDNAKLKLQKTLDQCIIYTSRERERERERESYLDIGCGYGHAVKAAFDMGFSKSIGINLSSRYDNIWKEYEKNEGIYFYKKPITDLKEKFDFITSYAAFEHFQNPPEMLSTISQLLNKNSLFYTCFSPIYNCDDGMHMYPYIYIPWYQHLFCSNIIQRYINDNNLQKASELNFLNKYSALDYFLLFTNIKTMKLLKIKSFYSYKNIFFLNIVKRYINKTWEELLIRGFEVIYQK